MKMQKRTWIFLLLSVSLALILLSGCKKENQESTTGLTAEYSAEVPSAWYNLFLEIDRFSSGYRPPAAARALAYTGLAVYETVVPGMPEYNSLGTVYSQIDLPKNDESAEYNWALAANAAYSTMFQFHYPHVESKYIDQIKNLESRLEAQLSGDVDEDVVNRSIQWGQDVAKAVIDWSRTDVVGHEAYKNPHPADYVPPVTGPNGEKLWQPTYPDFTRGLFPSWGKVRPFALKSSELIAKPPLPWSEDPNSKFYLQALETKIAVDEASLNDIWIAEFWSDDIFQLTFEPAGRLVAIANQLIEEDKLSLDQAAETYAKLGMALADAGIAVWNSKYIYNVERPITYIRRLMDKNWLTILNDPIGNQKGLTPPFPAYPSGHSGFGAAGAGVLTHMFGVRTFTDHCHVERTEFIGIPRTFSNFGEMGREDAYSRLPLGVHFRMDCDEGVRLGDLAANRVISLPWKK